MKNPWKRYSKINPQREEGNRQISNEVYQALMAGDFKATDYKIILAIINNTWGFGKQSDAISIGQFSEMTNLSERTVQRTLKKLKSLRVTVVTPSRARVTSGSPLNQFMFNKHYDTWRVEGCQNVQGCHVCHPPKDDKGDKSCQIRVTTLSPTKESTKERKKERIVETPKKNGVPSQKILGLYHDILPELPKVVKLTKIRQTHLKSRWHSKVVTPKGRSPDSLEFWEAYFKRVRTSDFLMGDNDRGWKADFDFLVTESKFISIIEGSKYFES